MSVQTLKIDLPYRHGLRTSSWDHPPVQPEGTVPGTITWQREDSSQPERTPIRPPHGIGTVELRTSPETFCGDDPNRTVRFLVSRHDDGNRKRTATGRRWRKRTSVTETDDRSPEKDTSKRTRVLTDPFTLGKAPNISKVSVNGEIRHQDPNQTVTVFSSFPYRIVSV